CRRWNRPSKPGCRLVSARTEGAGKCRGAGGGDSRDLPLRRGLYHGRNLRRSLRARPRHASERPVLSAIGRDLSFSTLKNRTSVDSRSISVSRRPWPEALVGLRLPGELTVSA